MELIDAVVEQMILMVVVVVEEKVDMVQDQVLHLNQQEQPDQIILVAEAVVVKKANQQAHLISKQEEMVDLV